jgi:hypothetical protein
MHKTIVSEALPHSRALLHPVARLAIAALVAGLTYLIWELVIGLGVAILSLDAFLGSPREVPPAVIIEQVCQWILFGLAIAAILSVVAGSRRAPPLILAWSVALVVFFLGGLAAFGVHALLWYALAPIGLAAGLALVARRYESTRPR